MKFVPPTAWGRASETGAVDASAGIESESRGRGTASKSARRPAFPSAGRPLVAARLGSADARMGAIVVVLVDACAETEPPTNTMDTKRQPAFWVRNCNYSSCTPSRGPRAPSGQEPAAMGAYALFVFVCQGLALLRGILVHGLAVCIALPFVVIKLVLDKWTGGPEAVAEDVAAPDPSASPIAGAEVLFFLGSVTHSRLRPVANEFR